MNNIVPKITDIKKAEFTVLDFETTGTRAGDSRVIEIGMVKVKNLKIKDTYSTLLNPGVYIPYHITQLTGISNTDVVGAPRFEDIIESIIDFIGNSIIAAHNLPFDYSFLKSEFNFAGYEPLDNPRLCTLRLSRKLFPELKSRSLSSMVKFMRLRHKNVHRALGDASVTAKLLIKLIDLLRENEELSTVEELLTFQTAYITKGTERPLSRRIIKGFEDIPDTAGVYFFKDSKDRIIYIGKAASLSKRLRSYISDNAYSKSAKILAEASSLEHKITHNELFALLLETTLIKKYNPPLNTLLKKYPQNYFIKVRKDHIYPDLKVSTEFDFDGNDYFGPYNNRDTANQLIDIINRSFELRECKDKDLAKNKKCYLADIHRCLAPCVGNGIERAYEKELLKVYEFLENNHQPVIDRLLFKMKDLSSRKKYEEAADIRDTVQSLLNQFYKTNLLNEPVNSCNVLIEINSETHKDYLLIIEGKVFAKDLFEERDSEFENVLDDYFGGSIHLFPGIKQKDLEYLKISLNWLIKNKTRIRTFYLKEFNSKKELFMVAGL